MVAARRVRWALYVVGGVVALLALVILGLEVYLRTAAGRSMVARQIEKQIGMPVEVTSVRVGLASSSIGLKVFDPAAKDPAKAEVLDVGDASADVTPFELAAGHVAPKNVALRDVTLTLHVDADGEVITTLPKTREGGGSPAEVPAIELTGGRVRINQDGRPPFALEGMHLSVEPAGDDVKLSGAIDDPRWSKWTVQGSVARPTRAGSVELASADAPLTMERLTSVPFVPAEVWKHVRADGRGAASVRFWTGPSSPEVHYAVQITPRGASLTLPDADVTLANLTGGIGISGSTLTLTSARAELAGGNITVSGTCDFGADPTVLRLNVSAEKLDTTKLPERWQLRDFEGKLQGQANLVLRIYKDGRIEPEGGGEGKITDVKVLGFPADDVPIHLRKAGDQYEFQKPKGATPQPNPAQKTGRARRPARAPVACAARPQDKKDPPKKDSPAAQPKKAGGGTTLDATIRLRDIELSQLLERLKVKLNYRVSGKVTAVATIAVPVGGVTSSTAYRFSGRLTSPALTLEGLTVRDFSAMLVYENETFTLSDLSGKIDQPGQAGAPPGTFKGAVTAVTKKGGDVTAALTIERIPVGEVLKALPGLGVSATGLVGGKVDVKAPSDTLSDPAGWNGSADVTSEQLVIEGRTIRDVRLVATVAKGVATLKEATLSLEGIPVTADATVELSGKYPFTALVKTAGTSVTDLRKLAPEVNIPAPIEGVLDTDTRVKGTASPLTYTATGTIKATKLTLAKSSANRIEAKWELTPERFVLSELKADLFGGSVSGSANVPLAPDKSGEFEVNFKNFDAGTATALVPDFPVKVAGKISGRVAGTIAPAKEGQSRVGNLDVDLSAPKLTVQGFPAERLVGKVTVHKGVMVYELEGKTLGGSFEVKGRYPGQKKEAPPDAGGPVRGSARITGIDLSRVAPEVGFQSLTPLRGRLDANFTYQNDLSSGSGRVRLTRLQWGHAAIAQEVVADLVLEDGLLRLANVTGRVAGGEFRARGQVWVTEPSRNFFTLALDGAEAKTLLAPFFESANLIEGPLTLVVHGRLGRETSGSGTLALSRGSVAGVQVSGLTLPFNFASSPGGYGRFAVHQAAIAAGTGRATAGLVATWGVGAASVRGQVQFTELPLRTISPELGESSFFGNGRITGRFDLEGSNVRSAADLRGTLVARLNNTSVREIPILRQTTPFFNPSGLTKPFQSGDIRATLSNGLFRVQRLALANPAAQLFAEGTVSTSGRLDLAVIAHTGTVGPEARALRLFGLRLPAVGPIPLTLVQDVSTFFSNRTVRLTITGTVSNPVVRVNVGALLSEEAVRFLLGRYLPAGAAGALGVGVPLSSSNSK